jgi:hypothetical protein
VGSAAGGENRTTIQIDDLGPGDWFVVEFPGRKFHGEIAAALNDFVERGIIRDTDGSLEAFGLADLDESEIGQLRAYEAEPTAIGAGLRRGRGVPCACRAAHHRSRRFPLLPPGVIREPVEVVTPRG